MLPHDLQAHSALYIDAYHSFSKPASRPVPLSQHYCNGNYTSNLNSLTKVHLNIEYAIQLQNFRSASTITS